MLFRRVPPASDGTVPSRSSLSWSAFKNRSLPRPPGYRSLSPESAAWFRVPLHPLSRALCGHNTFGGCETAHPVPIALIPSCSEGNPTEGLRPLTMTTTIGISAQEPPRSTALCHASKSPARSVTALAGSPLSANLKSSSSPPFAGSRIHLSNSRSCFPRCGPGQDSNPLLGGPPSNLQSSSLPLSYPTPLPI